MSDLLDILDRLIAFDTVSNKPNGEMVDYIESLCRGLGAICTRLPSDQEGKVGLVARFGPDQPGGILLSGHCDVVPAEGQAWTRPAFQMTREGDRLFGRGTTDMKGYLACMLAIAQSTSGLNLQRPLTLVFSYDEEVGCVGIQEMQSALPALIGNPRLCIVGEPTQMAIATGHKGKAALRATCTGQNGHSALAPNFVNAVHLATDFVNEIKRLQEKYADNGARDAAYDVPYSTLHVGTIHGGKALNIVPDRAEVTFEYRYLPADDAAAINSEIEAAAERVSVQYQARFAGANVQIEQYNSYPGLDLAQSSDAARFAQSLAPSAPLTKVAFGTEAGVFTELGLATLVCGPGSMKDQGHKPDEYVELAQLIDCMSMLDNAVQTLR